MTPIAQDKTLRFKLQSPFSFDPLEFDFFTHHATQRPALATLVSHYKAGTVLPVIAESWSVSNDKKLWTFKIRPGLIFEDGTAITAIDVKRSITRMAYLMKKAGSHSGLLENIEGYASLNNMTSDFSGLVVTETSVTFRNISPSDRFLEKIAFGL